VSGHVYLIGSPTFHWYKIGKSSNAAIRVNQLGILLPFRIEVVAVWKVQAPRVIEYSLHKKYEKSRINGEWFHFEKAQVDEIVADMLWASTPIATGFSNLPADYAPEGKIIKFRYNSDLTPEERERRKQEAMFKKRASKNLTPAEREERKQKAIAERKAKKNLLTAS
jgi:hypothetical protein